MRETSYSRSIRRRRHANRGGGEPGGGGDQLSVADPRHGASNRSSLANLAIAEVETPAANGDDRDHDQAGADPVVVEQAA